MFLFEKCIFDINNQYVSNKGEVLTQYRVCFLENIRETFK